MKAGKLPVPVPPRKWWALKRVWTLFTVVFFCCYLGVLRFGARVGRPARATRAAKSPKAAASPPTGGLAVGYARLATEGRAGLAPLTRKGEPYANDVNDMGACNVFGMEGPAAASVPLEHLAAAPVHSAAAKAKPAASSEGGGKRVTGGGWLGALWPSGKGGGAAASNGKQSPGRPWEDPTLASPLCLELFATEPWRSSSSSTGSSAHSGGAREGDPGGAFATKYATSASAKLWSAPVCGFLARELAAAAATATSAALDHSAAPAQQRSLASGDLSFEGPAKAAATASSVVACGGVRVTGGDLARMCGREPRDLSALLRAPRAINPYSRNASHTFFMWNKALAAACDASPTVMVDDGPHLPLEDYLHVAESGGRTFYVVTTQLLQFIEQVVPRLRKPFVVVTGSSDVSGPLEGMGWSEHTLARVNALLAHPLLVAIFAQNPDYKHPKMVPIHIGFDFHTIGRPALPDARDGHEWGQPLSVPAQDAELAHLRCALPPFSQRPARAVMNFKASGRSVRGEVFELLINRPGIEWIERASRSDLWRRYGEFAFVVSPRGYGKDCHRTWEALALGSAVIVSRDSFMAPLYEDLPVVQISDWSQVTEENLAKWKAELGARWHTFRFEKLRTDFWLEAIHAAAQQGSLEGIWAFTVDTREARGNYSSGQLVWGRRGGKADPPWQYWG
jgi:hypothetical protein